MRDGALDHRDLEEILLGLLDALGDSRRHFLGLAVADTDLAGAIADDHQRGKAEPAAALDDLGHTIDRDDLFDVIGLVGATVASATPTIAATTADRKSTRLNSSHVA